MSGTSIKYRLTTPGDIRTSWREYVIILREIVGMIGLKAVTSMLKIAPLPGFLTSNAFTLKNYATKKKLNKLF